MATIDQPPPEDWADIATPKSNVSAFARAFFRRLLPKETWDVEGTHNETCFLKYVDTFINLRKRESMALHQLVQGLKVCISLYTCLILTILDRRHPMASTPWNPIQDRP